MPSLTPNLDAPSYTHAITTPADPLAAFDVAADPQRWWITMIQGSARAVGDVFELDVPRLHHAKFRVSTADPGHRLVWDVVPTGADTELPEWTGTHLDFTFTPAAGPDGTTSNGTDTGSVVTFTHHGLTPALDCHQACASAWNHHLTDGLEALLNGRHPDPVTPAQAAAIAATNPQH